MNRKEAIESLHSTTGFFRHWMPKVQREILEYSLDDEEGDYFADMLTKLKARIEAMPKSYATDGQGDDAVAHLHYFRGSYDAWITERDVGVEGNDEQHQAFGKVCYTGTCGDAELGYISIEEVIEFGVEMDLYWEPIPLKEIR